MPAPSATPTIVARAAPNCNVGAGDVDDSPLDGVRRLTLASLRSAALDLSGRRVECSHERPSRATRLQVRRRQSSRCARRAMRLGKIFGRAHFDQPRSAAREFERLVSLYRLIEFRGSASAEAISLTFMS